MTSLVAEAKAIAELLKAAGVNATHDPRRAASSGNPIILVPPPAVDYSTRRTTWTLVACGAGDAASLSTFEKLSTLVEQVLEVDDVPIESASPGSYPLVSGQPPTPCYLLRLTT